MIIHHHFGLQSDSQCQSFAQPEQGSTGPAAEGICLHPKRIVGPENMWGSEYYRKELDKSEAEPDPKRLWL